jgi:hypothetical protein
VGHSGKAGDANVLSTFPEKLNPLPPFLIQPLSASGLARLPASG